MNYIAKFGVGYEFKAVFDYLENMQLIFDRTQADVDRVKELNNKWRDGTITDAEKTEWNNNLKGAINTSDLTRILTYINYLATNIGVTITAQTVPEIPTESWYETLGNNLSALRTNYTIHSTTPKVPLHPYNTYKKWNDIEKLLYDIYEINSSQTQYYAGDEMYMNNILI